MKHFRFMFYNLFPSLPVKELSIPGLSVFFSLQTKYLNTALHVLFCLSLQVLSSLHSSAQQDLNRGGTWIKWDSVICQAVRDASLCKRKKETERKKFTSHLSVVIVYFVATQCQYLSGLFHLKMTGKVIVFNHCVRRYMRSRV